MDPKELRRWAVFHLLVTAVIAVAFVAAVVLILVLIFR